MTTFMEDLEKRRKEVEERSLGLSKSLFGESLKIENAAMAQTRALADADTEDEALGETTQALLKDYLKGRMSRTGPEEDFADYFKKTTRPASEWLQDSVRGYFAGRTGQRFLSTKQEAFQNYTELKRLSQEKQQLDQTAINQAVQVAQRLQVEDTKHKKRLELERIKQIPDEAKRQIELKKFLLQYEGIDVPSLGIKAAESQAQIAKTANDISKMPDARIESVRRFAEISMQAKQPDFNMEQLKGNPELTKEFEKSFNEQWKRMYPEKKAGSGASPTYRIIERENGFGGVDMIGVNSKNPEKVIPIGESKVFPQVKLSTDDNNRIAATDRFADNVLFMTTAVLDDPDILGGRRAVPEAFYQAFGIESFGERTLEGFYENIVLERTKMITGAQVTDNERNFIRGTFAKKYSADKTLFINDFRFASLVAQISKIRTQAGQAAFNQLDLTPVLEAVWSEYASATKDGQTMQLTKKDADAVFEMAAELQGKRIIRDSYGNIRGIE